MAEKSNTRSDLYMSIGLLLLSAILYYSLGSVTAMESSVAEKTSGAIWPRGLIILMAAGSLWLGVNSFINLRKEAAASGGQAGPAGDIDSGGDSKTMCITAALMFLFVILTKYIGLILLTPFYLFAFMFLLGMRRYWLMAACSLGATAVIIILFIKILYIPLPLGVWLFKSVNLLFF